MLNCTGGACLNCKLAACAHAVRELLHTGVAAQSQAFAPDSRLGSTHLLAGGSGCLGQQQVAVSQ